MWIWLLLNLLLNKNVNLIALKLLPTQKPKNGPKCPYPSSCEKIERKRQQPQTHHWHLRYCRISATNPIYTRSTVNPVCHINPLYTFLHIVSRIKHSTIVVALSALTQLSFLNSHFFHLFFKILFSFQKCQKQFYNAWNFKAEFG